MVALIAVYYLIQWCIRLRVAAQKQEQLALKATEPVPVRCLIYNIMAIYLVGQKSDTLLQLHQYISPYKLRNTRCLYCLNNF